MTVKMLRKNVENLNPAERAERKLMLHYWYIDTANFDGRNCLCAHGIVSGHKKLPDANFIHTSEVKNIVIDKEHGAAVLETRNSVYYCPLEYCEWEKQEEEPEVLPEYEWIRKNYQDQIRYPTIEEGKVLLVLSNFNKYYFNSLYYKPAGSEKPVQYMGCPHIGMLQDSYLINTEDRTVNLAYFPHYRNIEFYSVNTGGHPLVVENIGDITLFVRTSKGILRLEPGERKEVTKENAETETPVLWGGDLYPAGFIFKPTDRK